MVPEERAYKVVCSFVQNAIESQAVRNMAVRCQIPQNAGNFFTY